MRILSSTGMVAGEQQKLLMYHGLAWYKTQCPLCSQQPCFANDNHIPASRASSAWTGWGLFQIADASYGSVLGWGEEAVRHTPEAVHTGGTAHGVHQVTF